MDEIQQQRLRKKQHLKELYKKVYRNILQKCVTFNSYKIPYLIYTFNIVTLNGLPLMHSPYQLKRYIIKKLQKKEHFTVEDISTVTEHKIKISW